MHTWSSLCASQPCLLLFSWNRGNLCEKSTWNLIKLYHRLMTRIIWVANNVQYHVGFLMMSHPGKGGLSASQTSPGRATLMITLFISFWSWRSFCFFLVHTILCYHCNSSSFFAAFFKSLRMDSNASIFTHAHFSRDLKRRIYDRIYWK